MEIVSLIKDSVDDNVLRELTDEVIKECTEQSKIKNISNCIGEFIDINPTNYHIEDPNFETEKFIDEVLCWDGYIPLGTKIVYGSFYNPKYKSYVHEGCYYYVDDDSYLYDFFKLVKEKEVDDEYDIIWLAHLFIKKLFDKKIDAKTRNDVNKLIYKDENLFFRPSKEHSIKDFYHNGSAMCSEIAMVAENLLSAMGLEVYYVEDKSHAFNICAYYNEKDGKTDYYVLDYSNWVSCYDVNHKYIGTAPFIAKIEGADYDTIFSIVNEGKRVKVDDYYILNINGSLFEAKCGKKREYGIDYTIEPEKKLILKHN